jgi:hypothetical protein
LQKSDGRRTAHQEQKKADQWQIFSEIRETAKDVMNTLSIHVELSLWRNPFVATGCA